MAISIAGASAKDKPSEAFLKKAIEGNFAEVSMGDLAQKNGQSEGVKSYGKMLSTDHAAANQKALDAAKDLGMNPPTGPNAKQKGDYDKMSKMSGAQFDKAFAAHMVADHNRWQPRRSLILKAQKLPERDDLQTPQPMGRRSGAPWREP